MKLSFYVSICVVLMFIVMTPFTAMAEDDDTRFYTNVKAGVYIPSDRASDAEYDTGFSSELSAGYFIFPSFAIEGSVGYFNTHITADNNNTNMGDLDGKFDMSVIPVTISAMWVKNINISSIYVGGGLGAYYQMIDGKVDTSYCGSFRFNDAATVFGFHVLVGYLFNLSENIYLGLEWKPLLMNESEFKSKNSNGSMRIKPDLDGRLLSAVFGIRF